MKIDKDGNFINDTKLDSGKEKIKQGLKEMRPEVEKKQYLSHQPKGAKQLIQEGLEELKPSVDKDGVKLQPPLTVEQKALAKIFNESEDEYREAGKVGDKDDRSRT